MNSLQKIAGISAVVLGTMGVLGGFSECARYSREANRTGGYNIQDCTFFNLFNRESKDNVVKASLFSLGTIASTIIFSMGVDYLRRNS